MHITFNRIRPTPPKSRRSRRRQQDYDRLRAFLVTAGRHRDHLGLVSVLARGASLRAFVETVCAKMATLGVPASDAAWLRGKLAAGLRRHLGDDVLPVGFEQVTPAQVGREGLVRLPGRRGVKNLS